MKILIADDEVNIRESLRRLLELEGMQADAAADGAAARRLLETNTYDLALLDLRMPGLGGQELLEWINAEGLLIPVIMISAHGEILDAVRALKSGARDFVEKPFDSGRLIARIRQCVAEANSLHLAEAGRRTSPAGPGLIGEHASIREIRGQIARIAAADSTVLVTGESGTGKEVVARELHRLSPRSAGPFVAVNVGGIPDSLVESELFGHEKGAFTSADSRRIGLFELAGSGSLFLDEIGDMPFPLQVKLLRVLQERKVRRLGGTRDVPVNARIISATNRDLERKVKAGEFREDLFYRLNVIRINVPPLRDRLADLPLLCDALIGRLSSRMGGRVRGVDDEALRKLCAYSFPGNVRELENILERAWIYCPGGTIRAADIDIRVQEPAAEPAGPGGLRRLERETIAAELKRCEGNRTKAAKALGISRRTIIYKIQEYGLAEN